MTTLNSTKRVAETLQDLRALMRRYEIEDYEPIPEDGAMAYSVRYRQGGQWLTISSRIQPTRAQNLRQCYQTIQYLLLWGARGVGGVSQGVTFIGGGLAKVGVTGAEESMAEAYTTIGVEPSASWEEIQSVYRAKVRYVHPDSVQDQAEKKLREERLSRLNTAFAKVEKARGKNGA